jgi:pimeloyl-ACP methyl ester carboxylesterase
MTWSYEQADGQTMAVRRFGSGPELVWLHGLGAWSVGFNDIVAHPAFAGFSHVMPDLPGCGRSPWPAEPDGLDRLADRLAAWLDGRRPAIIGHSMGGVLAQLIGERIPLRAVINVDGNLSRGDCTFSGKVAAYSLEDFVAHGFAALRKETYDGGLTYPPLRGCFAAMTAAQPHSFYHHSLELIAISEPETLAPRLAALSAPSLFVAGVPDGICAYSRSLLDRHAIRWIGPEPAGHWVHDDQPEAFASSVVGFLREV